MKFGLVPIDEAEGAVLAHATTAGEKRFRKAHRLSREDIAALKAAGYRFRFPDYRAAFDHMWASGDWRDGAPRSPMKR
ncbi:hypothetical protein FJ980_27955 [Mesorhizobium sp. B1-1-5]|nr:hypothetical protein FJ980_27955 [Mesorhizobium sp. B1-1-5]